MKKSNNNEEESYYDILEVGQNATLEEIKKKKKDLSLKYHPDKLPEHKREWGTMMIQKINEAFEVLKDPKKRKMYDQFGKEALNGNPGFSGFGGFGGFDMNDIFSGVMGKSKGQKIQPIKVAINVSLEDLFTGKNLKEEIERFTLCKECDNTGFEDKQKHKCKICKGNCFVIQTIQIGPGMIQQCQRPCAECNGLGNDLKSTNKCKKCDGNSVIKEKYIISIEIKAGMQNKDVIEIKKEGHELPQESNQKYNRGDIYVFIKEIPHEIYKRGVTYEGIMNPSNLSMELEITLCEALCGFVKSFKYLDGNSKYLDSYDVIKDGDIRVIKDLGLPHKGTNHKRGDLFVKFQVKYPNKSELTNNKKEKLYELLTDNKFNNSKIHKLPKYINPVIMEDIKHYKHKEYYDDDDDNMDNERGGEHVQCAQQ